MSALGRAMVVDSLGVRAMIPRVTRSVICSRAGSVRRSPACERPVSTPRSAVPSAPSSPLMGASMREKTSSSRLNMSSRATVSRCGVRGMTRAWLSCARFPP